MEPANQIMVVVQGEWFWNWYKNGGTFATNSLILSWGYNILVQDVGAEKLFWKKKNNNPLVFFRAARCSLALTAQLYRCRQLSVVSILADFNH